MLYLLIPLIVLGFLALVSGKILAGMGRWVVLDEKPPYSDAIVVLNTGVEYYPRLIQAAEIYRHGLAGKVVINGNRKTDILRRLEDQGFKSDCPWYADSVSILTMLGVPEDKIIWISAEDAYDTVSEADAVGREIVRRDFKESNYYHQQIP